MQPKARIVCLCGSTRFSEAYQKANLEETLAGRIVLTIGVDMKSDAEVFKDTPADELEQIKQRLDELHKRKIDLADEILVLNVGGYVGSSTRSEIAYAIQNKKGVRYLEHGKCENCGAELSEAHPGGTAFDGKKICCAACMFHPMGCRCKYGQYGIVETYRD